VAADIEADSLTTFEVAPDGSRVCFHAKAADGKPVSMSLPAEALTQMVMSLPRIVLMALRRRHANNDLRIVYPTGDWQIEKSVESDDTFIVTLSTPDGFEVSFALDRATLGDVQTAIGDATGDEPAPAPTMN
jgi:hypothetical protein